MQINVFWKNISFPENILLPFGNHCQQHWDINSQGCVWASTGCHIWLQCPWRQHPKHFLLSIEETALSFKTTPNFNTDVQINWVLTMMCWNSCGFMANTRSPSAKLTIVQFVYIITRKRARGSLRTTRKILHYPHNDRLFFVFSKYQSPW